MGCAACLLGQWVETLDSGPASSAGELTEGQCRNSQHNKNCVSLSSCWKTKSKKVNKRFVPELKKVASVFRYFHASEHFTYLYYGYITLAWIATLQLMSWVATPWLSFKGFSLTILSKRSLPTDFTSDLYFWHAKKADLDTCHLLANQWLLL